VITTYDVRVWKTEKYQGSRVTTYSVRWKVEERRWRKSFRTAAQAESFRAELLAATRKGEAFDTATGRPVSVTRSEKTVSWYDFACAYVDMKWKPAAATYRRGISEALTTATCALVSASRGKPDDKAIRAALFRWAFNTARRDDPTRPDWVTDTLKWLAENTKTVSAFDEPAVVRAVLTALASRLDGGPAAATVFNRKRAVLSNALAYAVELNLLASNPVGSTKWTAPKRSRVVDRRSVVNPSQARALLDAVGKVQRSGKRLVAFFAVMYYAGLRPEEAVNLRRSNMVLPKEGWGELHVETATPHAGRDWTDSGEIRDSRQLKHREHGETRVVPCPPALTAILHKHLSTFGVDDEGRLFVGERGGDLAGITYGRVWARARAAVFTPEVYASPLARRPYDLRHAAVSTWLNGGVPATQVAEWAGHSVEVLLRVYAKCLDGQESITRRRVEEALR
jgi:integrase